MTWNVNLFKKGEPDAWDEHNMGPGVPMNISLIRLFHMNDLYLHTMADNSEQYSRGGGVLPYLCMVGKFRGDDFGDFQSTWVPILYHNTIRLTLSFCRKNLFVSITLFNRFKAFSTPFIMRSNPINFLYNLDHVTLWCVEVGPVTRENVNIKLLEIVWEFDCLHFTQYMPMSRHDIGSQQTSYPPDVRSWWETFTKLFLSNIINYHDHGELDLQWQISIIWVGVFGLVFEKRKSFKMVQYFLQIIPLKHIRLCPTSLHNTFKHKCYYKRV